MNIFRLILFQISDLKNIMTDDGYRQVFIKNIPYSITEQELSEWCSSFGEVMRCDLKRDKTGQSRGFGFVTFATIEGHNNIRKNHFF